MSNQQAVAFASFGLFVDATPADFPSTYDVRFGVDNGEGDLGTLTSPTPANVRSGVQYGGDGNQYTGTLYVPSASGGLTWTEDALELWHDEIAEFGYTVKFQSWTFQALWNPIRQGFSMNQNAYNFKADSVVDILRSDAITSGLYQCITANPFEKRPQVALLNPRNTAQEQIVLDLITIENDDATQPSIRIFASKHQ